MLKKEKESLSDLINLLKIKTKKNQSQLSVEAGYEPQTLAQLKAKGGNNESVIRQLRMVYKDVLNDSIDHLIEDEEKSYSKKSFQVIYTDILEKRNRELEKHINANFDSIEENQKQLQALAVLQLNQLALVRAKLEGRPVAKVQDEINRELAGVGHVKSDKGAGIRGKD